jgi:pimeloyl-ACP methyl ester carboxylesterase
MPLVALADGTSLNCIVDDFLWPWQDGVPVFVVHGFARNAHFWDRWVPALAASDRRVYRPEVRGCGASPAPPEGYAYDAGRLADELVEVMDGLGLERVHWVGEHSGSLLGLLVALQRPERIASLVLCDAPTRVPERIHSGVYPLGEKSTADALIKHGVGEWCAKTIDYRLDTRRAAPGLVDWYVQQMARTPVAVAAGLTNCFGAVDLGERVADVAAPTLLLSGGASDWIIEQQQATVARMPDARIEVFEGYGHGLNVLEPAACVAAAVAFWDQLQPGE